MFLTVLFKFSYITYYDFNIFFYNRGVMGLINKFDIELIKNLTELSSDPLKFVKFAFGWGKNELENKRIEPWQEKLLIKIRDKLLNINEAILCATASGHGIGKSAFVSWIILWALSTKKNTKGIVTANTETQLKTKTWAELSKWHNLFIAKHLFEFTATALFSTQKDLEKTWRFDMIAWSERNTEAFAGMHNQGKRVVVIFDEASAIPDPIWEVTEGALTDKDTEILWLVFGNPTRNTGRFKECFTKNRHRWETQQIDSREVSFTNKEQINKWIVDCEDGENSDFVKVRVRGIFPSVGDRQFIPSNYVDMARGKHINLSDYSYAPSIIGVDPASDGGDETVMVWRQGNASKILATWKKVSNFFPVAEILAKFEDELNADAVFIDVALGHSLRDIGNNLGRKWQLIYFGSASSSQKYYNKRSEMWGNMREWLKNGGCIPNDAILCNDLISPEYVIVETGANAGKELLEKKSDMRRRNIGSPDRADALALTFAFPVKKKDKNLLLNIKKNKSSTWHKYNDYKKERGGNYTINKRKY